MEYENNINFDLQAFEKSIHRIPLDQSFKSDLKNIFSEEKIQPVSVWIAAASITVLILFSFKVSKSYNQVNNEMNYSDFNYLQQI